MCAFGLEASDASPASPAVEIAAVQAHRPGPDRQLHAQDSDRVYQAVGNQYIFDTTLPAQAAARNTLPRDIASFTGRSEHLAHLVFSIRGLATDRDTIPIFAIDGMPGVGKTTLAVHAAHLLSPEFPDGQMFIDMHAHTAGKVPVEPTDALLSLLSVGGMRVTDIPDDADERSAVWRDRMAGRRSILIIDNVASYRQVESLLPGAAGCLVLVTSRRRLTGLGTRQAATIIPLDPLPPDQAISLFLRLTERSPEPEEERAIAALVRLCGHLPLAISMLAVRISPEPNWRVQTMVDDLTEAQDRLSFMRAEDIQIAAAFDLSYQYLPVARRRFFRRLGLSVGTDIDVYAAAALGGVEITTARRHLDALYDDRLIDQPVQGRYRLHDLLGAYARTLVSNETVWRREQAVARLLDYYQHAAMLASTHIAPQFKRNALQLNRFPVAVPTLADTTQALAWMNIELPNLLACASYAVSQGDDIRLINIAGALASFLRRAGSYQQSITLHRAAAEAARRHGDRGFHAAALYHVGVLLRRTGDFPAATQVLTEARALFHDLGDLMGEADAITALGTVQRLASEYPAATKTLNDALTRYQQLAEPARQAEVLTELSVIRRLADDHRTATRLLARAVALHQKSGNRLGQADALLNLSAVQRLTYDYTAATETLQQANVLYRCLRSQLGMAHTQFGLGVVRRLTGDRSGALHSLDEALEAYRELGDTLGCANTLKQFGILRRSTGDHTGAAQALLESLSLYQDMGNPRGRADALQELGVVRWLSGNTAQAIGDLTEALAIFHSLGTPVGEAEVLNYLGTLLLDKGDPGALGRFRAAERLAREAQNPLEEARAIEGIARCSLREHEAVNAVPRLREALEIYQRIGAPEATQVRTTLASLNGDSSSTVD